VVQVIIKKGDNDFRNSQLLPEEWRGESFRRLTQENQKAKAYWGKRTPEKSSPAKKLVSLLTNRRLLRYDNRRHGMLVLARLSIDDQLSAIGVDMEKPAALHIVQ
jgi:hypothetical protein